MEFTLVTDFTIRKLVNLIESDNIDLKPYYQRNDIWSKNDQQDLINSIVKGYPLPSFFIYERSSNKFEMVDGQQRARTIYRFYKNQIELSTNIFYDDVEQNKYLDYLLSVTIITKINSPRELEEFYVLVNKKGKHLTKPELNKAEFAGSKFLLFVESLLDYQPLINLNIFTPSSQERMNDRDFIEELIAYLIHGVQDKKSIVEHIYNTISDETINQVENKFKSIIDLMDKLNSFYPIIKTRFKQKSDFYSLFNFLANSLSDPIELVIAQYKSLLLVAPHISPSRFDCLPLREYAINCVSQSNSKSARQARLDFLNNLLRSKVKSPSENRILGQVVDFIVEKELFEPKTEIIQDYMLIGE